MLCDQAEEMCPGRSCCKWAPLKCAESKHYPLETLAIGAKDALGDSPLRKHQKFGSSLRRCAFQKSTIDCAKPFMPDPFRSQASSLSNTNQDHGKIPSCPSVSADLLKLLDGGAMSVYDVQLLPAVPIARRRFPARNAAVAVLSRALPSAVKVENAKFASPDNGQASPFSFPPLANRISAIVPLFTSVISLMVPSIQPAVAVELPSKVPMQRANEIKSLIFCRTMDHPSLLHHWFGEIRGLLTMMEATFTVKARRLVHRRINSVAPTCCFHSCTILVP